MPRVKTTMTVTATSLGNGVWDFECDGHEKAVGERLVSSPKHAIKVMRQHVDQEHPGERAMLKTFPTQHARVAVSYTGVERNGD